MPMDSAENKCEQKGLEGNLRKQIEVVPAVNLGALQLHSLVQLQKATGDTHGFLTQVEWLWRPCVEDEAHR